MKLLKIFVSLGVFVTTIHGLSNKIEHRECRKSFDCPPYHACIEGTCQELTFTDFCVDFSLATEDFNSINQKCQKICADAVQVFAAFTPSSKVCPTHNACVCKKLKK